MGITLANFQLKAIEALMEAMGEPNRDIILKSCTGSGKTIILTHFMDEYLKSTNKAVFVWLTPGKGNLELQSKAKMDKYIHGSNTKLLSDIMSSGFEENDACFINWEKLTKKGNNALKDSERTNFVEHIQNAIDNGLTFTIIVDESHQNDTIKADDILALFNANKIIRCSATPKNYKNALLIEIPEEDVIAEGLIKKLLIINENFEQHISVEDQISYLLDKALEKQRDLRAAYAKKDSGVNPLIIVQLPNKSDALLDRVEEYFESKGITYENNLLSVWLSDKKQNLEDIEDNDATPIAVIIKQAVATGWDCPRAQILVKLRDNMSEVFEIQTIGRIRRMPEAKHYGEDLLDCCYLYTLDEKFTESVKLSLGTGALDAYKVFLKPEYRSFTLISQFKTDIPFPRDAKFALKVIWKFFEKKYHTATDLDKNQSQLEAYGYSFNEDIVDFTKSGSVSVLSKDQITELNDISIHEPLNKDGDEEKTHLCIRLAKGENRFLAVHESNHYGITLKCIIDYLNEQFKKFNEDGNDPYHYTIESQIMPGEDFLSSIKRAKTMSVLKLTVYKDDIKDGFMRFAGRTDIADEVDICLKRPKGYKCFPENLIKEYFKDSQDKAKGKIKRIKIIGTNDAGSFEVDTNITGMKHFLKVKGESVTNEVESSDFFVKAQEFIASMGGRI